MDTSLNSASRMQILNLIALGLALLFLVPGYIIHSIISSITLRRRDDTQLLALRFLTFSAANALICTPFLLKIKKSYPDDIYSWSNWWIALAVLFVVPVALGILISYVEERGYIRQAFTRIKLGLLHPSPSAWETHFKNLTKENYAHTVVTLVDGRKVYGYFGDASIASSDSAERDLYLQRVYDFDNNTKTCVPRPGSGGILIKGNEIGSIEFIWDDTASARKALAPSLALRLRNLLFTQIRLRKQSILTTKSEDINK